VIPNDRVDGKSGISGKVFFLGRDIEGDMYLISMNSDGVNNIIDSSTEDEVSLKNKLKGQL